MLPRVKINYLNGQLGTVAPSEDGLFAVVYAQDGGGWPVEITGDKVYVVRSFDEYAAMTDDAGDLFVFVKQFYQEAAAGTELIIYRPSYTSSDAILAELSKNVKILQSEMSGRLRGVFVYADPAESEEEIDALLTAAQACAASCASDLYAPIFVCTPVGAPEEMAKVEHTAPNVVALAGSDVGGCNLMGYLAGRLASIPVHRNIGRVKDGAIKAAETLYLDSEPIVAGSDIVAEFHAARTVVPRQYVGLSGYYFADDPMMVAETDDYAHLTARRTVDKAYRIAYQTLVQFMLDEIEVNEDGTMQNGVLKSWQQAVENAINRQMTAKGELSATDGEGCVCFIDPTQNVLATSRIELTLKVKPYGYARFIDVNLGFQVTA